MPKMIKNIRQKIIKAGLAIMAKQGLWAVTSAAIARKTKLGRTTILYHFPSTRNLQEAVWEASPKDPSQLFK